MKVADLRTVARLLRDAGRDQIMPLFRNLADGAVKMKTGPLDLVTEADEAAERQITAGLRREFPGCVVVGEEAASARLAVAPRGGRLFGAVRWSAVRSRGCLQWTDLRAGSRWVGSGAVGVTGVSPTA